MMKNRLFMYILSVFVLFVTVYSNKSNIFAESKWNMDSLTTIQENGYSYVTLFSKDAAEAWVIKVDVPANSTELFIPEVINHAKVVAIGYSWEDSSITDEKYRELTEKLESLYKYSGYNNILGQEAEWDDVGVPPVFKEVHNTITKVILPESIQKIAKGCFGGFSSLKTIKIPSNVTKVDDYTFFECSKLESVTLPTNMKEYSGEVFRNCQKMKSLKLAKSNRSFEIKNNFLIEKKDMTVREFPFTACNMVIPKGVKGFNGYFWNGSKAKIISIPKSLKVVNSKIFESKNLKKVTVDKKNSHFAMSAMSDNNLYNKKTKELIMVIAKNKKLVISDKIKQLAIDEDHIVAVGKFNRVYLPSSVKKLPKEFKTIFDGEDGYVSFKGKKVIMTGKKPSKTVVKKVYDCFGKVYVEKKYLKEYKNLFTKKDKGYSKRKIVGV